MLFLDFPIEEYQSRLAKIQKIMADNKVDGLVLTDPSNLIYFTGYRTILYASKFRPFLAVIPQSGEPVLVLPNLEVGDGVKTAWVKDVRGWGKGLNAIAPDAFGLMGDVLREKKLDKGRIGIELATGQRLAMTFDQWEALKSQVPAAEFVNSADLIWQVRIIKSLQELDYIRASCKATDAAFLAAIAAARPGVTERELQRILGRTMMDMGADAPGFLVVASGPQRYDMINPFASDRTLQVGDMLNFDIGAIYRGYWSDLSRGVYIGSVTDRQREFYKAEEEIFYAALNAVKPHIPASAVDKVTEETTRRIGFGPYMLHRTGHSLGLDVHELPSVAVGDETILLPGMIITIEPGVYDFSIGAWRIEDTVLVTDTGYELLTNSPRQLMVL